MMTHNNFSNEIEEKNDRVSPKRFPYWNSEDDERRKIFVEKLEERFSINFEYIVLNCVVSILLTIAFLTNQFSFVILALLIAPPIIPLYSFSLGISLGSIPFLRKAISSLFFAALITFSLGLFSGFISTQIGLTNGSFWSNFEGYHWANFILIFIGLLFAFAIIIRNPKQSISVANVAIAYIFYLPLFISGISLFRKDLFYTQNAINSFIIQFLSSIFFGVIILFISGVRSKGKKMYLPLVFIISVIIGGGFLLISPKNEPDNNLVVLPIFTKTTTVLVATNTKETNVEPVTSPFPTLIFPEESATDVLAVPTLLIPPTYTPTVTLTPLATPVWAEIRALESNGVNVRADPGYNGRIISTILNGTLVEVLSEVEVVDSITWVHIRLPDQTEGWIVRDFLISSTPAPDW